MVTTYGAASAAYQNTAKAFSTAGLMGTGEAAGMPGEGAQAPDPTFLDLVSKGVEKSIATNYKAEATKLDAMANKAELHDLVTSVANAELTLQTVVAIRDKVISAYQDIIRMPI